MVAGKIPSMLTNIALTNTKTENPILEKIPISISRFSSGSRSNDLTLLSNSSSLP